MPQEGAQGTAKKRKIHNTACSNQGVTNSVAPNSDVKRKLSKKYKKDTQETKKGTTKIDLSAIQSVLNETARTPIDGVMEVDRHVDYLESNCYADDQLDYLQRIEKSWVFSRDYLSGNGVITRNMRSILVDWLIQVQVSRYYYYYSYYYYHFFKAPKM